jgi:hypothetical protein
MDGITEAGLDRDASRAGEGGSPSLTLDGFAGPLDHLLSLARAQTIDLAGIALGALLDQLAAALRQAPAATSLGQKGDWVVMAAWLVQLRSRLLLPADAPARQDATAQAGQLRDRLVGLQDTQVLALWRTRARHDGVPVGQPRIVRRRAGAGHGNPLPPATSRSS